MVRNNCNCKKRLKLIISKNCVKNFLNPLSKGGISLNMLRLLNYLKGDSFYDNESV